MRPLVRAAAMLATALLPAVLSAGEPADGARLPIVAVALGRAVESDRIDEVVRALDLPVLRGPEIGDRLDLIRPIGDQLLASLTVRFARASDLFFSGRSSEAKREFEQIAGAAKPGPALVSNAGLRGLLFRSHLYLAMTARAEGDASAAAKALATAAALFPDQEPGDVDFPPWLCAEFREARQSEARRPGKIVFDAPDGCSLVLSGADRGRGPEFPGIAPGVYSASAQCRGQASLAQSLVVNGQTLVYRPLVLWHGQLAFDARDLALHPESDASPAEIAEDLLTVARAGGWPRLLAVVGTDAGSEIWLLDARTSGVLRRVTVPSLGAAAIEAAAARLRTDPGRDPEPGRTGSLRNWYRDGAAWALLGSGVAILAVGIAIGQAFGTPSAEAAWSYALMAGGGALAGTGVVLFFFPGRNTGVSEPGPPVAMAVGLAAGGRF